MSEEQIIRMLESTHDRSFTSVENGLIQVKTMILGLARLLVQQQAKP